MPPAKKTSDKKEEIKFKRAKFFEQYTNKSKVKITKVTCNSKQNDMSVTWKVSVLQP
jgi:hypothetical protein